MRSYTLQWDDLKLKVCRIKSIKITETSSYLKKKQRMAQEIAKERR